MLAVKLHKKTKPFLGEGSHVVPVFNWRMGDSLIHTWSHVLNWQNRGNPNNKVRYMTLVRIPDDLPVSLHFDWAGSNPDFRPWKDHPMDNQTVFRDPSTQIPDPEWFDRFTRSFPAGNGLVWTFDPNRKKVVRIPDPKKRKQLCVRWPGYVEPSNEDNYYIVRGKKYYYKGENLWMPEMVLGAPLTHAHILWTKDARLLHQGNRRSKEVDRRTKKECSDGEY